MSRDLIRCPGAEHKMIDRADAGGVPSRLWDYCVCGRPQGYGISHPLCDWTAENPDEAACLTCGRYRNCTCVPDELCEPCAGTGYVEIDAGYQGRHESVTVRCGACRGTGVAS